MKTFNIRYSGVNYGVKFRLSNNPQQIDAETAREAVEKYYSIFQCDKYWPQPDGRILDANGVSICDPNDDTIEFDGGFFYAEEV